MRKHNFVVLKNRADRLLTVQIAGIKNEEDAKLFFENQKREFVAFFSIDTMGVKDETLALAIESLLTLLNFTLTRTAIEHAMTILANVVSDALVEKLRKKSI
ncbi:MAG: hypothetical protein WC848_01630 [Parcubacteria group bacterium]|jgi:hypothetical protein